MNTTAGETTRSPRRGGRRRRMLLPVALVVVGLLVLLYPVAATQWNNLKFLHAAQEYSRLVERTDPGVLDRALNSAHRYNATKATGPILDPWLSRVSADNADYQDYLRELNQQEAMARLIVPAAHIDLAVYHGTSDAVLQRGVGHLFGSDLPVGGAGTHAVLTGHTGLTNGTLFDNLSSVKVGDPVYVAAAGQRLKYVVDQTKVVLPEQTDDLAVVPGADLVTLVTCTPYGINSHRLLVRAHRVAMDPVDDAAFAPSGLHWQWWMWPIIGAAIVVLALLAWWIRRALAPRATADGGDRSDS